MSNNQSSQHLHRKGEDREPTLYTIIRKYATRLKYNLAKTATLIMFETSKITTKQGRPAIIFSDVDFLVKCSDMC